MNNLLKNKSGIAKRMSRTLMIVITSFLGSTIFIVMFPGVFSSGKFGTNHLNAKAQTGEPVLAVKDTADAMKLILYGKDLIANTSRYLGPKGSVMHISNGMNCQNCHLDAGTKPMGNNYTAVYSTYPKYRARSASTETIVKRISDCFERSLNGQKPDSSSKEMKAMVAYMKWVGKGVPKGVVPKDAGISKLAYLERAAEPKAGGVLYKEKCAVCHGAKGQGAMQPDGKSFVYPPLWGNRSYNDGAGLFRVASFAGFIKDNMPFGTSHENPILTDEQAWDLAAFVNTQPRPHKDQALDWKNLSQKPIDFPFGPYSDAFPEKQHKYGPFKPIAAARAVK
ncbi:c-type cytochrome [Dyadobacter sp. 32]|uniref:c-type cytochrome n=1 Tax=Dyadobacter sp. 32 TaxID=538966 RepID=UPI0039C7399E